MKSLEGFVILVTGAGGGIGSAICSALAANGARVVATDVTDTLPGSGYDKWMQHDVTSEDEWRQVARAVNEGYGRLDCLVNNAGISQVERLEDTLLKHWRQVFDVNVTSVLLGMKICLPLLRSTGSARKSDASVVNIASTAGLVGVPFNAAYSASKGAVRLLSKSVAKEWATLGYPIRVNSVCPGLVGTPMMDLILSRYVSAGIAESVDVQRDKWMSAVPMQRIASPGEIAEGVVFLCSDASSYMTGSELVIDGGVTS